MRSFRGYRYEKIPYLLVPWIYRYGKILGRTFKLTDYISLDDIIDEIHYRLPYGDKRKVVKLEYRSPSIDNEGNIIYNNFELKNREDVLAMWRTNFDSEENIPLELEATVRRTIE